MMRYKRLKLSALLLVGLGMTGLKAQTAVTSSGGNASGSGGSVSYSVGQVAYQSHTGSGGSVFEGVQQPYEISVLTGIKGTKGLPEITLSVDAYPNPTTDYLKLRIQEETIKGLSYQLYNMGGRLIERGTIESRETTIDMDDLVPATYFVKIMRNSRAVKTFKVIKN